LVHEHRRPAPPGSQLSLSFEPNGTGHDDLVLRLGTWAHRSDSYYYELDHPAGHPPDEARAIKELLASWVTAIEGCADGDEVFLPHAFFDQCSGWLRCTRRGDAFEIVDGWSGIEGWSMYPSDFTDKADAMSDFRVDGDFGAPVVVPRARLLADIEASICAPEPNTQDPEGGLA